MRHQYGFSKLNRHGQHRRALLRNLATALLRHERIETTLVKAKALRGYAEHLITLGKRGDLHSRRLAAREVHDHEVLQKLFADLAPRFSTRNGGYTRVLRTGFRRGDNAPMSLIELVDFKPQAPAAEAPQKAPKKADKPEDTAKKEEAKAKKAAEKEARGKAKAEKAEKAEAKKKAKAEKKPAKKAAEPKAEKKAGKKAGGAKKKAAKKK